MKKALTIIAIVAIIAIADEVRTRIIRLDKDIFIPELSIYF